MANSNEFALPGNGVDVLRKVVHAYVLCGDKEVNLKDVAAKAGMDPTQVSRNNGFLSAVGVIEGGQKKKLTALGHKLGIAVSHDDKETIASTWRELIGNTPKLKSVVDMVRVQNGISTDALPAKVAALFGLPGGKASTTTAVGCVIDVLKDAELLEDDGHRVVSSGHKHVAENSEGRQIDLPKLEKAETPEKMSYNQYSPVVRQSGSASVVPIHINIELHLPASGEKSVYDAIFKSIRENLMETGSGLPGQA